MFCFVRANVDLVLTQCNDNFDNGIYKRVFIYLPLGVLAISKADVKMGDWCLDCDSHTSHHMTIVI